jgi:hypothetical protein
MNDQQKIDAYLDWVNNYVSIARFAEHYGLTPEKGADLIDEGRKIHEAEAAEHLTPEDHELLAELAADLNIIDRLKITRPEIAITVTWEEDHEYEWCGDGEDPITEGFYPYNVDITASTIRNGELIEGNAYLGGCYSKDGGKDDPEIGGYLDQLVEEAVAELDKAKPIKLNWNKNAVC